MKRVMTLIGSILGTVAGAVGSVMLLITTFALIDLLGSADGFLTVLLMFILPTLVVIATLIICAVTIPAWNKDAEGYKKKKGLIITAIVFNFISAILAIALFGGVVMILCAIVMIAAAVLHIVDLCLEGKRVENATKATETVETTEE